MPEIQPRKAAIVTYVHPDEKATRDTYASFDEQPIAGAELLVANVLGKLLGLRDVDCNMTGAFPGDPQSPYYESRQAHRLVRACWELNPWGGFDIHGMRGEHAKDVAIIDAHRGVTNEMLGVLRTLFGIEHVAVTREAGLQAYCHNFAAIEMTQGGLGGNLERFREGIKEITRGKPLPTATPKDFSGWFAHPGRDKIPRGLTDHGFHIAYASSDIMRDYPDTTVLRPVSPELASSLGYAGMAICPLTWHEQPNENGYWGEGIVEIDMPDSREWLVNKL